MTLVNMNSVAAHCELYFIDDALSSGFNSQDLARLQNVVRSCESEINARGEHNLAQTVPFNEQLVLCFVLFLLTNDCANYLWNPLDYNMR